PSSSATRPRTPWKRRSTAPRTGKRARSTSRSCACRRSQWPTSLLEHDGLERIADARTAARVEVRAQHVAGDLGGAPMPHAPVLKQNAQSNLGTPARREADEPARRRVAPGRPQRPRLAGDAHAGQEAPATRIAERTAGSAALDRDLHHARQATRRRFAQHASERRERLGRFVAGSAAHDVEANLLSATRNDGGEEGAPERRE